MGRAEWAVSEVPQRHGLPATRAGGQSIALLGGAILSSLLLIPATTTLARSLLGSLDPAPVRVDQLGERGVVADGDFVRFDARLDPSSATEVGALGAPRNVLVMLTERDDVLLSGSARERPLGEVLDLVRHKSVEDPDAVANRELTWPVRTFVGRVHDIESDGSGFWKVGPEELRAYARDAMGLAPPWHLRVVDLDDTPSPGNDSVSWGLWAWALAAAATFWAGLFWTRRRALEAGTPPGPRDLVVRDPTLVTVLCCLTLGVYQMYWNWVSTRALARVAGRADLAPGFDLALSVLTLGLWGVYVHWRNAAIVDGLLQPLRASNVRWQVLGLYLASVFCSLTVLGALYKLAEGYREVAWMGLRDEVAAPTAERAP